MIHVSLKDSLLTGQFGPIESEMSQSELLDLLGPPDAFGCCSAKHAQRAESAGIWKYGDIEFHFDDDRRVALIFTDTFDEQPEGGAAIDLDAWIFRKGLTLAAAKSACAKVGIRCRELQSMCDDDVNRLAVGEMFEFWFIPESHPEYGPPGFAGFSIGDRGPEAD